MIINKSINKENKIIDIALEINPTIFNEERSYFYQPCNAKDFINKKNSDTWFVQYNKSFSEKGKLERPHYQSNLTTQGNFLGVKKGILFDVKLDLRENSKTLKNKYAILDFHHTKKIVGLTLTYLRNKLFKFSIINHLLQYKFDFK